MSENPTPPRSEHWDFYFCTIDDRPASILVDLAVHDVLSHSGPPSGQDTLYLLQLRMQEPGDHGLGTAAEAEVCGTVENAANAGAAAAGFRPIGRVRNEGVWRCAYMGPAASRDAFVALFATQLDHVARAHEVVVESDPTWSCYLRILFPSAERRRWMLDRGIVERLAARGDDLEVPRRVEHRLGFTTAADRRRFAQRATRLGFTCEDDHEPADDDARHWLTAARIDPVTLDAIHTVTERLADLADSCNGIHDGWRTHVVLPE